MNKKKLLERFKAAHHPSPKDEAQFAYNDGWIDALKAAGISLEEISDARYEAYREWCMAETEYRPVPFVEAGAR